MKKLIFILSVSMLTVCLWANPQTMGPVSHPTTQATVNVPRTNVIVKKPTSTATAKQPITMVEVKHPTTIPTLSADSSKGGSIGGKGGSYTPSYKNAKTVAPTEAATPKAAKLGKGESGLGKDKNANQKAAEAAASSKPKGEDGQPSIQDVLKKTNLPSNIMGQLKQRNFEAAGVAKHSK